MAVLWNMKAKKPGKYFSTSSSGVLNLFVMLYIFCGIGKHFLISGSSFEYLCKCYSDPNQRESQLGYRLCKDDNILKALEICF